MTTTPRTLCVVIVQRTVASRVSIGKLDVVGPFDTFERAQAYADRQSMPTHVVPLDAPQEA